MNSYLDALDINLPAKTQAGKTRLKVFSELAWAPTPTTLVSYVSSNRVLVIADKAVAQDIQSRMPEKMLTYLAVLADQSSVSKVTNAWNTAQVRVKGYLGRFEVFIDSQQSKISDDEQYNLGLLFNIANGLFDQVIDCSESSLISAVIKPPGYYHLNSEGNDLQSIIETVSELIGEFEKPKYFNYDPDICAHGSSGISGCTRCLDACPTQAIISIGDKVQVNPYLCQGGGSCSSSCPSGAISYSYPKAEEQIEFVRQLLQKIRSHNNDLGISLLIYDNEHGGVDFSQVVAQLPEFIIPFVVEDIGSVGLDLLSSAMAYGAIDIYVYLPESLSDQVVEVMNQNFDLLRQVIGELKLEHFQLTVVTDLASMLALDPVVNVVDSVARFSPVGSKRNTIRSALMHFNSISEHKKESISLPAGSLFGQIKLNEHACTLCMACVSVCPGKALHDGGDSPALNFIEVNCLQCGICENACPESAIELEARIHFDHNAAHTARALKEEQPFRCLNCGKPFATQSMIKKMTEKLKGHWMFDDDAAMKRLQMCEDCRVIDMFKNT